MVLECALPSFRRCCRDELYAVQWVRIVVHAIRLPEDDDANAAVSPEGHSCGLCQADICVRFL